jgi:hypothetical protein
MSDSLISMIRQIAKMEVDNSYSTELSTATIDKVSPLRIIMESSRLKIKNDMILVSNLCLPPLMQMKKGDKVLVLVSSTRDLYIIIDDLNQKVEMNVTIDGEDYDVSAK